MTPRIFDRHGTEQDWAWLQGKFGQVSHTESQETTAYRLVRIQERQGHSSFVVSLIDADGNPIPGITVIRYWPGAPPLPAWNPPPERWYNKGVHGETNAQGDIGYGMGPGDLYYPPAAGASAAWVGELGVGSDCFHGLGWIVADTDLHLDLTFQRTEGEPPPPPPDFETEVLQYLDQMLQIHALSLEQLESTVAQLNAMGGQLREIIELIQGKD